MFDNRLCLVVPSQSEAALSRWENEGGASIDSEQAWPGSTLSASDAPLTQAELKQLRIRVVALENVLVALLAHASEAQRSLVRHMAEHISPRPGFTPHRVTLIAADEIVSLVGRSDRFRR